MKNLYGYIGIVGALGMAFCDMVLLAQPVSGSTYDLSSFGAMPHVSAFRASVGSLAGIIFAYIICFGFWHIRQIFESSHQNLSNVLFIAFCSVEFFGGAFHAAYYFISGEHFLRPDVLDNFVRHLSFLSWLGVPGYLMGNFLFFRFASDKRYPTWFRFTNPLLIQGVFLLLFTIIPAPLGGYLKPTFMNVGFAVFFFSALLAKES